MANKKEVQKKNTKKNTIKKEEIKKEKLKVTEKEEKSPAAEKNSLHFWETAYTIIREAEIF